MRRTVIVVFTGLLVLAGLQPATASSTPSQVGLVSFVGAGYSRSSDTASLSLDWPDTRNARYYQVYVSRSYRMTHPRTHTVRSSRITLSGLSRGRDYFVQVRGVNGSRHGTRSKRVGHTTIVRPGPTSGLPLRVMTYNLCSAVCDEKPTTRYPWKPTGPDSPPARQPRALERIAAASPDILATQEAGELTTPPPGYTQAMTASAKRLYFKTSRFDVAPGPAWQNTPQDGNGCRRTTAYTAPIGHIFLGRHSQGCRYAVWARLVDKASGKQFLVVDVHTVTGTSDGAVANRLKEMNSLFYAVEKVDSTGLPVVFAGDFNSHKNRSDDVVGTVMNRNGFHDAYDLARSLTRQHYNSYNDFRTAPVISYTWGDHVDHVYVRPSSSRVDAWRNAVLIGSDGRLVKPIPSDHSPVVVDVRID